jgi:hypothetical protein
MSKLFILMPKTPKPSIFIFGHGQTPTWTQLKEPRTEIVDCNDGV